MEQEDTQIGRVTWKVLYMLSLLSYVLKDKHIL